MKLYSMIEELSYDPKIQFSSDRDEKIVFAKVNPFCIGYINSARRFCLLEMCEHDLMADWEKVREKVDFMTAANSGKRIKPINHDIDGFLYFNDWNLSLDMINGKWEIE